MTARSNPIQRALHWLYVRLEARRTAVASVTTVIVLLVVSLQIPQRGDYTPRDFDSLAAAKPWLVWADSAGLTDIYRSAPMLAAFALLLVNLWLSFAARLEHMRKETTVEARPATAGALARNPIYRKIPGGADAAAALQRLGQFLARKGYKIDVRAGALRGVRHRLSVYGSVLFHLSFLLLLVAMGLRATTRFHGVIAAGVGESYLDKPAPYLSTVPRYMPSERLPDIRFVFEKFEPGYHAGSLTDATAHLRIGGRLTPVRVNVPAHFGATTLRLVEFGFAPVFIVRETDKRLEHGAAVTLLLTPPGRADTFSFPGLPVTFSTRLYPDYKERYGMPGSYSQEIKNPAAAIHFTDVDGVPRDVFLFQGMTKQAGRLEFQMPAVTYWCRFEADRDYGRWPMYLSLIVGFLGLAWRMLLPRQRIDAVAEAAADGAWLHVAGFPDYTHEPFATEFQTLLEGFAAEEAGHISRFRG